MSDFRSEDRQNRNIIQFLPSFHPEKPAVRPFLFAIRPMKFALVIYNDYFRKLM